MCPLQVRRADLSGNRAHATVRFRAEASHSRHTQRDIGCIPVCEYYDAWAKPMEGSMERFVHLMNLQRLRLRLSESKDEAQRRQIEKIIAEEEAKSPTPKD